MGIVAGEELPGSQIVYFVRIRLRPWPRYTWSPVIQLALASRGCGIGIRGSVAQPGMLCRRGMLHVLPEIDEMGSPELNFPAGFIGLRERAAGLAYGWYRSKSYLCRRNSGCQRTARDVPIQALAGVAIGVHKAISPVIPNTSVEQTCAGVTAAVGLRGTRIDALARQSEAVTGYLLQL